MTDPCLAFSALGQTTRLTVFRHLVAAPKAGQPAGRIAEALGLKPNTLSSHLAILQDAGLVFARREGRQVYYALNRSGLTQLLGWLMQDCCAGRPELCGPDALASPKPSCC